MHSYDVESLCEYEQRLGEFMAQAAAQGIGALGGMFFGVQAAKAGFEATKAEAGSILYDGEDAAEFHLEQTGDLLIDQKLGFLKSGFTLEGSPLMVMQDTLNRGKEDARKILAHAERQAIVAIKGGRARFGAEVQRSINQGGQGLANAFANQQNRQLATEGPGV